MSLAPRSRRATASPGASEQEQVDEEPSIPPSLSAQILIEVCKKQQEEMLIDSSQEGSSADVAVGLYTSSLIPVPAVYDEDDDDIDEAGINK